MRRRFSSIAARSQAAQDANDVMAALRVCQGGLSSPTCRRSWPRRGGAAAARSIRSPSTAPRTIEPTRQRNAPRSQDQGRELCRDTRRSSADACAASGRMPPGRQPRSLQQETAPKSAKRGGGGRDDGAAPPGSVASSTAEAIRADLCPLPARRCSIPPALRAQQPDRRPECWLARRGARTSGTPYARRGTAAPRRSACGSGRRTRGSSRAASSIRCARS